MSNGEVIAVFASAVAVTTSMFSTALSFINFRRDRAHLRVETAFALIGSIGSTWCVIINVINDGRYAETVNAVGFWTKDGKSIYLPKPEHFPEGTLPKVLNPNESVMAVVPANIIRQTWVDEGLGAMTWAFAQTRSGRTYKGKPRSDIQEYALKGWYTDRHGNRADMNT